MTNERHDNGDGGGTVDDGMKTQNHKYRQLLLMKKLINAYYIASSNVDDYKYRRDTYYG